jgi:2,4-dienoyl-CoA reductase-like NADH-dependent reductase (Old Yellow Enzyme family)/thioredoxin reductase
MKLIHPTVGRRQFLIGSIASASALALKNAVTGRGVARASETATGAAGAGITTHYPHLLSPIRVRNQVMKNRIFQTPSPPHTLQGPENYPGDAYRAHYSQVAKNAAMVTLVEEYGPYPKSYDENSMSFGPSHYSDSGWEEIPPVRNYVDQLVEDIHCEGTLVCCGRLGARHGGPGAQEKELTAEDYITQAREAEDKGYDAIEIGERGWSGIEDIRKELDRIQAARRASNLIIVAVILPFTPGKSRGNPHLPVDEPSGDLAEGPEMAEVLEMVKLLEGTADIVRMKDTGHYTNHPNSFTMERDTPWMLRFAQAIKESGSSILTAPNGGFHNVDMNESFIAGGKTDLVAMATPLIADPEYVQKALEGRGEDITPCVRCHNCHGISRTAGPWFDACTVNPKWGLSETKKKSIRPAGTPKKVAVIGGGPAGMKAALTAVERGHRVTLYEKSDAMGGLLRHTDHTDWKWAHRDFKNYLVRQVAKAGIDVKLNTAVTPEMIRSKGYDTVMVAMGASPAVSRLPGADGANVFNILEAYSRKAALGKKVVLIGAGTFGTETAICLAKDGHEVMVLASGDYMIPKTAIGPHNKENQIDIYQNHPNISYELETMPVSITGGKVVYRDASGKEKSVTADSVVINTGLKPKMEEALEFIGSAGQVLLVGDCTGKAGTVQKTIRSAFFMASQV